MVAFATSARSVRRWVTLLCLGHGAFVIDPVRLKVPLAGSYSSADASELSPLVVAGNILAMPDRSLSPPAMSTRPSGSRVAVCFLRGIVNDPLRVNRTAIAGA